MHNEYFQDYIRTRAGLTEQWSGTDTQEAYKLSNKFGKNLFLPTSFSYNYNKYGFRCDEFGVDPEVSVLFLGCSFTEGTGLPVEETWAHKLLTKIRNATGKLIPYWNLAIGGTGVDTQARFLYEFGKIKKPNYVFAYFPPIYRREYCYRNNNINYWIPAFKTNATVDKVLEDRDYAFHRSYHSFMTIDALINSYNSKAFSSSWSRDIDKDSVIFKQFASLNYFNCSITTSDLARDSLHSGPLYQTELAEEFWKRCRNNFQ